MSGDEPVRGWSSSDANTRLTTGAQENQGLADDAAEAIEDLAVSALTGKRVTDREDAARDNAEVEMPVHAGHTKHRGKAVQVAPRLALPHVRHPEAIALFVHGGDEDGDIRVWRLDPGYLRMLPFARDVERRSHGRIGAAVLRLAVRGWNEPELPAVRDTEWALDRLNRRYPNLPIALVGHSMGGRVMLNLFNDDHVDAAVGLAPWITEEYQPAEYTSKPLTILHGRTDLTTSPKDSAAFVDGANAAGGHASFVSMPGGHSMVRDALDWQRKTSQFLIDSLLKG